MTVTNGSKMAQGPVSWSSVRASAPWVPRKPSLGSSDSRVHLWAHCWEEALVERSQQGGCQVHFFKLSEAGLREKKAGFRPKEVGIDLEN